MPNSKNPISGAETIDSALCISPDMVMAAELIIPPKMRNIPIAEITILSIPLPESPA